MLSRLQQPVVVVSVSLTRYSGAPLAESSPQNPVLITHNSLDTFLVQPRLYNPDNLEVKLDHGYWINVRLYSSLLDHFQIIDALLQ